MQFEACDSRTLLASAIKDDTNTSSGTGEYVGKSHEASASATGYLFQCRYALLAGLRATLDSPQLEISIEKFDDIAFEADGNAIELIQTKHHIANRGNLTDGSTDLWKTLLIWSKLVAKNPDASFRTRYVLLVDFHAILTPAFHPILTPPVGV